MMVYHFHAFLITNTHLLQMASGILGVHVKVFVAPTVVSKLDTGIVEVLRQTVVQMVQTMMRMLRHRHVRGVAHTNAQL